MINLDAIKTGLYNDEFFLEYLPTIDLENNRCIGAEALIRWKHLGKVVPPLEFIPLIENTPLSGILTYWVIEQVAQELGTWLRVNNDIHISINVPPEILGRGGIEYALVKSGLIDVVDKLVFEITERGIPDQLGINAINSRGKSKIRVALDDFEADMINLIILSRVKVDIIKLDKSFLEHLITKNNLHQEIQRLSAFIYGTDFEIVAEGVETYSQAKILKDAGIKIAQGWYFSPPLLAKDFKAFFDEHR